MAKRSTVERLPQEIRHELERKLADNGFSDYTSLAEWLHTQGYEISRSAVHRYGAKIQRRFANIKASTEAARLIAQGASDEADTRSEAVIAMLQTEVFDALIAIGELTDSQLDEVARLDLMGKVAKNIAPLMSASTRLKEYQAKLQAKAEAVATEVAKTIKKGGLSDETADEIRRKILGITT